MGGLAYATHFEDLRVYQKAKAVSRLVFEVSRAFPREELYSLTDQIRRASRSIGAQIAEAWAKRRYERHFVSKLTDADAEQMETQHWVGEARDAGYLSAADADRIRLDLLEIGRMLNGMMEKAHLFCKPPGRQVRESETEFFAPRSSTDR